MKKIIIVGILVTMMVVLTGCMPEKIERTITIKNPSTSWIDEIYLEEITLNEIQINEIELTENWD